MADIYVIEDRISCHEDLSDVTLYLPVLSIQQDKYIASNISTIVSVIWIHLCVAAP